MNAVIVHKPRQSVMDGWPAVSAEIEAEGRTRTVYFRASRGALTDRADPFLAAALLPAMRLQQPLRVHGVVSQLLLEHIVRIQEIFSSWHPTEMHHVDVHADRVEPAPETAGRRVGSFFSGGVDSFYNVLKHRAEIDDLVFIHGFDVALDNMALRSLVAGKLRAAAAELGKTLVEVETNLRIMLDPYVSWNYLAHGPALGCVALAIAPQLRRIYIGATESYVRLVMHGSHPLIDPLWGHDALEIIHDGCEYARWPKGRQIVGNETVQRYLRVCYQNPRTEYNCGRCHGCVRAMILLRITGVADRAQSFPPLDLAQIAAMPIQHGSRMQSFESLLAIGEETMIDPAVNEALRVRLQQAVADGVEAEHLLPETRQAQAQIENAKADLRRLRADLDAMRSSRSWRLTAPLRALNRQVRRLRTRL
jgi:hypothetical protein